ncbi:MAG: signal peptide peptidase SppA [Candidatus Nanohalobium sp.]
MKKAILTVFILLAAASAAGFSFETQKKAAIIDLSGTITPSQSTGLTATSGITPEQVRNLNQRAKSQGADAIIYEINSGGGAVVASKEVKRAIEDVKLPTVCRMRDVAASGGYLISLGCDRIVADSSTLTGSIGVKSSYIQYAGLMEKHGLNYINISAGGMKEVGNPFMNASKQEKQLLQEKVDIIQQNFLKMVEKERNLTESQMKNVSSGAPFLGVEAKKLGLVDRLGGRDTAVNVTENLTGSKIQTFEVEKASSFNILSLLTADLNIGNFLEFSAPFRSSIGY